MMTVRNAHLKIDGNQELESRNQFAGGDIMQISDLSQHCGTRCSFITYDVGIVVYCLLLVRAFGRPKHLLLI